MEAPVPMELFFPFHLHFECSCANKSSQARLCVDVGNHTTVKFVDKLWCTESNDYDQEDEFIFYLKPKEWNKAKVKQLYGKYCLEFLDRDGQPFDRFRKARL